MSLLSSLSWSKPEKLPYKSPDATIGGPRSSVLSRSLPRRHIRVFGLLASGLGALLFVLGVCRTGHRVRLVSPTEPVSSKKMPPRYWEWYEREKQLPQHNPDLPYPQGRDGKYLYMGNHVWGVGWGNSMHEMILNAHLAYTIKVTYVFDNFTWDPFSEDGYSNFNGKLIPAYIPMTALVAGPVAGGPFPFQEHVPPAVMREYFDDICKTKTYISADELMSGLEHASASTIVHALGAKLNEVDGNCIEIMKGGTQLFDLWLFGDANRLLDVWPALSQSPILTEFAWSRLVNNAVEANSDLVHPSIRSGAASRARLPGLLALHIRRGDFEEHCANLVSWHSRFLGFNEMPMFIDRFEPPTSGADGELSPEDRAEAMRRCYPDIDQIVDKVIMVRNSPAGRELDRVYVLTNGNREWLDELKAALNKAAHWKSVATSRDMVLTPEQKYVAQATDMLIAERADVLIGNGFSSLTSNVVVLRMAKGFSAETVRFW